MIDFNTIGQVYPEILNKIEKDIKSLKKDVNQISKKIRDDMLESIEEGSSQKIESYIKVMGAVKNLNQMINEFSLDQESKAQSIQSTVINKKSIIDTDEVKQLGLADINDSKSISIFDIDTKCKPVNFYFNGNEYKAKSWREFATQLVEILFKEDPEKMASFIYNERLNGTKTQYFAYSDQNMVAPILLKDEERAFYVDIDKLLVNNKRVLKTMLKELNLSNESVMITISKAS